MVSIQCGTYNLSIIVCRKQQDWAKRIQLQNLYTGTAYVYSIYSITDFVIGYPIYNIDIKNPLDDDWMTFYYHQCTGKPNIQILVRYRYCPMPSRQLGNKYV